MTVSNKVMLVIAVLTIAAIAFAAYYFFMKAPKMSARDRYHSLGNNGINQAMTGKDYSYHSERPLGANQHDSISNTINLAKSDSVMPASWPANHRVIQLGSHY